MRYQKLRKFPYKVKKLEYVLKYIKLYLGPTENQ